MRLSTPGILVLGAASYALAAADRGVSQGAQKPVVADSNDSRNTRIGPFTPGFKKHVLETMNKWHVPGLSIAVIDGENTYLEGFGQANIATNTPVTPDTLFMAGSTTKAFTAAALGIMIASGNHTVGGVPLSWRTPLSSILPLDFVTSDPWATAHLTLEDASSHRTGLPRHDKASPRWVVDAATGRHRPATPRDVVRSLRHLPLSEEPRTTFQYCNLMYVALSHAVSALAGGEDMAAVLRRLIWAPLGRGATFFGLEDLPPSETLAMGYYWDEQAGAFAEMRPDPTPEIAGAGLVISSVRDYARWVRCLVEGSGPLGSEVHAAVREPRMLEGGGRGPFDAPTGYGGGWGVGSYGGRQVFTHAGMMEAFGADIVFFPDDRYGVVALGNTAMEANAVEEVLLWELIDEKFSVPDEKRYQWGKKWELAQQFMRDKPKHAVDDLFPGHNISSPLPPALPLDKYVGTYYHPAYQNMTIELGDGDGETATLKADRTAFTWQSVCEFKHVSGEFWVMYLTLAKAPNSRALVEASAVEFKIGVDGQVGKIGVEWRDTFSAKADGWIWYDRVY